MKSMSAAIVLLSLFAVRARTQQSAAPLDAPLVTLGFTERYGLVVDLDNDGFMDAISWWWANVQFASSVRLTGWHNDGSGKLVQAWTSSVSVSSGGSVSSAKLRIFPCNLDSDGSTDFYLVFYANGPYSIRALRSRGLVAPEVSSAYSISGSVSGGTSETHAVVADFTGDGLADLAYSRGGTLSLLEYVPGQPTLQSRSTSYPFGNFTNTVNGLMEIDANGDATPDLLAWRNGTIQLIEVAACLPIATQAYSQGIVDHHMPAVGDIDLDGDPDLVIWDMSRYVIARRTGAATWSIEPPVTGGPAEFLFDVDQDGDLDGVCCGSGEPDPEYNVLPSTLRVALNDGTGVFAPSIETSWLGSDHLAGIADLDHDGDLDVVAGRCILYARGPLTGALHPPLGLPKSERATADFDGDSDPDFGVGLRTLERNLGGGACTDYAASFPEPTPGTQLVGPGWPGDFDGDGDLDLVVKHFAGPTLLGQRLLVNLGGGAFADGGSAGPSGVDFNPGVQNANDPEASLVADADGDGDLDLITKSSQPGTQRVSRIWWNDGLGHFAAGPVFQDEVLHRIADLTGDGIPDLAGVTTAVGWHAGLGGGAFGPLLTLETLDAHRDRFALADLDADEDLDFAIFSDQAWLQLFWNDGTGVFTHEAQYLPYMWANTPSPRRVWSTDIDQDGRLDLLIAPSQNETNGVRILKRKADNSGWEPPFSQVAYEHSGTNGIVLDAVLSDVDGDGDIDFVTDRLVRNGTHARPDAGRRRQVGAGTPGTGGLVPTLGADGPFRPGESAELRLRGGVGGASGLLTITLVEELERVQRGNGWLAPTSERVLARIPFTLDGALGTAGTGSWSIPYTVQGSFAGQTRRYVARIYDAGAGGGVARSNELLLTYGP